VTGLSKQYWFPILFNYLSAVTNPLYKLALLGWGLWQSIGFLVGSIVVIGRRPAALVFYLCATFSILLLCYVSMTGAVWHMGHLFIAFLIALWLASYYPARPPGAKIEARPLAAWAAGVYIGAVLVSQVAAAAYVDYLDYRFPFSQGKAAAEYIRSHDLQNLPIVGDPDYTASTVAGYLDQPIYYIVSGRYGTFIIWDRSRGKWTASGEQVLKALAKLSKNGKRRVVLLLPGRVGAAGERALNAHLIKTFLDHTWAGEDYAIYLSEPREVR